jgi:hypothetical protein
MTGAPAGPLQSLAADDGVGFAGLGRTGQPVLSRLASAGYRRFRSVYRDCV